MEIQEYLQLIKSCRDDYSDDIPSEILHRTMRKDGKPFRPMFKCRKGWFAFSFYGTVELGIQVGYVNERSKKLLKDFYKYANETKLSERLTTPEDIRRANQVLTSIIEDLER